MDTAGTPDNAQRISPRYFHGTRTSRPAQASFGGADGQVRVTTNLDAAIWAAELDAGDGPPRVYEVAVADACTRLDDDPHWVAPRHPAMELQTGGPVTVLAEVTTWDLYHGTRAPLEVGDLVVPGHLANYGPAPRRANFVYFARTLEAAIWGAELAVGDAPERIYLVEPTGAYEDDPNLTNQRFRGNPSKSFRSRDPLRVIGEVRAWVAHPPETVATMKAGLARLAAEGIDADDA